MPPPILDVQGLCKSFGALAALSDVNLTLAPGELLGLAGPNGSGKSTLFNTLTHLPEGPDRGVIRLEGASLAGLRPDQIARRGLARIFQTETDFGALTVLQNVLISLPGALKRSEARAQALALLTRFGLEHEAARLADEIGVFQRKKLMIATALACSPKVLLLDEPAAGLSKPEIAEMTAIIRAIHAEGTAIIVIEHIMPLLLAVSQRLIVLNFGRVIADGLPDQVVRDRSVIEAYLGGAEAYV